jgi:hypothetical protein
MMNCGQKNRKRQRIKPRNNFVSWFYYVYEISIYKGSFLNLCRFLEQNLMIVLCSEENSINLIRKEPAN